MIAFDIGEPWTTHRKYQVFDDRYTQIFGRPEVNADRIVLIHEIGQVINQHLGTLKNSLVGKYVLTKFLVVSAIRKILETDVLGQEVIRSPEKFVRSANDREAFKRMIHSITEYLIVDLDVETQDLDPEFDYRGWLRDKERVTQLLNGLLASFRKDLLKKRAPSISEAWKAAQPSS